MQILAEKNKRMQAEQNMTKEESNELMKQRAMAEILKEESYKNVKIKNSLYFLLSLPTFNLNKFIIFLVNSFIDNGINMIII